MDEGHREDAADTLLLDPKKEYLDPLFQVFLDENESEEFRIEIAECIGSILRDLDLVDFRTQKITGKYLVAFQNERT